MRKSINILILLCACLSGFTQETDSIKIRRQPYIQLNLLTGSFWSRSEYLVEQFEQPYKAIEARFGYQLSGNKMWHQLHRYPKIGLGMHYSVMREEGVVMHGHTKMISFDYEKRRLAKIPAAFLEKIQL